MFREIWSFQQCNLFFFFFGQTPNYKKLPEISTHYDRINVNHKAKASENILKIGPLKIRDFLVPFLRKFLAKS